MFLFVSTLRRIAVIIDAFFTGFTTNVIDIGRVLQ